MLIPGSEQTPEEFRINPGESLEILTYFRIYPPYGTEVFKLISTFKPIDLRSVVAAPANIIRGQENLTPVERLFSKSFFYKTEPTRGQSTTTERASEMSVFSRTFVIEK